MYIFFNLPESSYQFLSQWVEKHIFPLLFWWTKWPMQKAVDRPDPQNPHRTPLPSSSNLSRSHWAAAKIGHPKTRNLPPGHFCQPLWIDVMGPLPLHLVVRMPFDPWIVYLSVSWTEYTPACLSVWPCARDRRQGARDRLAEHDRFSSESI